MNWKLVIVASAVVLALLTSSIVVMAVTPVSTGSPYKPSNAIRIVGDDNFTVANGVKSGAGTASDPYVIEGWEFGKKAITAIQIVNTTAHFIIRDISILAPLNPSVPGINLINTSFAWVSNVTIDGRSHGVKAEIKPGNETIRDIFITNSRITRCPIGIWINDTANVQIQENTISSSVDAGIVLRRCVLTDVSDNIIVDSARHGKESIASLHLERCNQTSIERNRVVNSNTNGIEMSKSVNTTVADNKFEGIANSWLTLTDSSWADVHGNFARGVKATGNTTIPLESSGVTLINVTHSIIASNDLVASSVYLDTVSWSSITSNNITNGTGITVVDCSNSTLSDNRIIGIESPPNTTVHSSHALSVRTSANMMIDHNVIEAREGDNTGSVDLGGIDFSAFEHNVVLSGNLSATDHLAGRETRISGNVITEGVNLDISGNNLTIDANNFTGASLSLSTRNTMVTNNSFWDGAKLTQIYSTKDTDAYHNDFMNGTMVSSMPDPSNAWDDGYPSGGNYWADNASADVFSGPGQNISGSDGIGDANVTIPGGAVDRYPLMAQIHPADVSAPISFEVISGPRGLNGWFIGPVSVTLTAEDDSSGVTSTHWRLDGGTWAGYTSVILVQDDGQHLLEYYSEDGAGNTELANGLLIGIDSTTPSIEITAPAEGTWLHRPTMFLQWTSAHDAGGLAYFAVKADNWGSSKIVTSPYMTLTSVEPKHYTLHVTATDDAGNMAEATVHFVITYESSISNWHGPYGALFNLALLFDFVALVVLVFARAKYKSSKSGLIEE